ncbi:ABC transporter substrate-binding protein [Nocardioides sediminis]|uniref:ABC transporter substrate-binding protein n=1 Tax=Nocardioides sediminis TaxID=433648 RepID=UPI000D2FF9BD|nr:ABC transporter substrate-binding protein [Nocardioides sediminis]
MSTPARRSSGSLRRTGPALALATVLLAAAGCGGTSSAASTDPDPRLISAGELTVCTSLPYEPFEFERDGETVGFEVDLAKAVAEELDVKAVFLNEDFDAVQSGELLNDDKCDLAAAGLTITGDRARVLDFSSPFFNAAQALVVSGSAGIGSLDGLRGARIAVQSGSTGELYVTDNAPRNAQIVPFDDIGEMSSALNGGTVDAGVYDNTVAGSAIQEYPAFRIAAEFDTGEQYGMAVKKDGNVDLLRVVNDVIADLKADGGYDKLYATWFGGKKKS